MSEDDESRPAPGPRGPQGPPAAGMPDLCVVCGSLDLEEVKCKVVCRNCGTILMSCEDL